MLAKKSHAKKSYSKDAMKEQLESLDKVHLYYENWVKSSILLKTHLSTDL